MSLKNTTERWGSVSQLLHWTIAVLILTIGAVGLVMGELPRSPKYFWVYTAHKSLGLTVLALVVVRIAWRLHAGAPAPVPGTPRWQARLASATHGAIYLLLLAMPLSGWLYDSATGLRPLRWFGLAEVPKLVAPDEALAGAAVVAASARLADLARETGFRRVAIATDARPASLLQAAADAFGE